MPLCGYCRVLELNDENGYQEVDEKGSPFLAFEPSQTTQLDFVQLLPLTYHRKDQLPGLAQLKRTGDDGCDFCKLLRCVLLEQFDSDSRYSGEVTIGLEYSWESPNFPGTGLSSLIARILFQDNRASELAGWNLIFAVESNDEELRPWLRLARLRHQDVLCQENINFVQAELRDCLSNCHQPTLTPTGFLPTRLLDVGNDANVWHVRLIESKDLSHSDRANAAYVALSYCWGPPEDALTQLTTTSESIDRFKEEIPESSMTQSLIDAVRVCKALEIRYLWVDAVCIIQDSLQDWEQESTMMAHVYQHAIVTAYAWASNSCRKSFLSRNRRLVDVEFQSRLSPTTRGKFSLVRSVECDRPQEHNWFMDGGWPQIDVWKSSLQRRAWYTQEKEMAPRKVRFGANMMHWQCFHNRYRAENGLETAEPSYDNSWIFDFLQDAELGAKQNSQPSRARQNLWLRMLLDYCDRRLTYATDRLPALSGMAKIMSSKTNDRYVAGIWESNLPESLLWNVISDKTHDRPTTLSELAQKRTQAVQYIAPTWSPLASERRVDFKFSAIDWDNFVKAEVDVLETNVDVQGLNPFGVVRSGFLKLRGRMFRLRSSHGLELKQNGMIGVFGNEWNLPTSQGIFAKFQLDWFPPQETTKIEAEGTYMLAICSAFWATALSEAQLAEKDRTGEIRRHAFLLPPEDVTDEVSMVWQRREWYGLLLCPSGQDGTYYRVGVWESVYSEGYEKDYIDQFEVKEVVII